MKINEIRNITRQALPGNDYLILLGISLCVFNSNNSFIIENILIKDEQKDYNWHDLFDLTSGQLSKAIERTITKNSNENIAILFSEIVEKRNRIIHSFQYTDPEQNNEQKLATKHRRTHVQEKIERDYLNEFIIMNENLSSLLHEFRGY